MDKADKIKEYIAMMGLTKKEIATKGDYHATEQYLHKLLNGQAPIKDDEEKAIYNAIAIARKWKISNSNTETETETENEE